VLNQALFCFLGKAYFQSISELIIIKASLLGDFSMSDDETKRCPFCDEEIRFKAIICKHCHQWLPGYTYESAIRDLVIQKQVTERTLIDVPKGLSREDQLKIARTWAKNGRQGSLKGFDLSVQDLSGVDLSGADLRGANFSEADLSGANLSEADLRKANLFRANLRTVNLKQARLHEAYLREAMLEYVDLSNSKLPNANLRGALLNHAILYRVDLDRVNLRGADLRDCNLRESYLKGTSLNGTKTEGMVLKGALLLGADLTDSDLTSFQYKQAHTLEGSILPDGQPFVASE
jgi:uncharacterized protein YjbI with pentapeptide repeats